MKKCKTCNVEKEFIEFYKSKKEKDGLQSKCKTCCKEYRDKYYELNKNYYKKHYINNKNKILKYQEEYNKANKEQKKVYNKEYNKANKERYKEYYQGYYQENKERCKEYYQANKEKINKYERNRLKTDNLYKLKKNLRTRTWLAFKNKGYTKNTKTQEMLGVDWEVCKSHIQRQFTKGMSWENSVEWHIDHIIPLSSANTEEELKKLCHYSNLQPLWAVDNLIKSAKINGQQNKFRF